MTNQPWAYLKPGDIVDVIAPAFAPITDDLPAYYIKITNILASMNLKARIPVDLVEFGADLFAANTIEYREKHLIYALNNSESNAVWAVRGGYGAAELIPALEKIIAPNQPKLLLGFSDITALHLYINNNWHWNSMHAPVLNQAINNPHLLYPIKPLIFGYNETIGYDNKISPLNDLAKISGKITAEITGGNLALVEASLATSWQIQAKDKIIFLEDVGERGYRIDRMLHHLLQAKVFAQAKAVIFGEITPELEADGKDLCAPAIHEFANKLNIPVFSLPFIGHSSAHNLPLPLGTDCNLILGDNPSLTCAVGGIHFEEI